MVTLKELLKRAEARLDFDEEEGSTSLCWSEKRITKAEYAFIRANWLKIMRLLQDRVAAEGKEAELAVGFFKSVGLVGEGAE